MKPSLFVVRLVAPNTWICEARNGAFFSIGDMRENTISAMASAERKFTTEHQYPVKTTNFTALLV